MPTRAAVLAEHAAAVADLLSTARAVPADAWERPMAPGKWSPSEVAEHLRLTYVVIQGELDGGTGLRIRTPWLLRVFLRWRILPRILSTGKLPAGAQASSEIRPAGGPFPREQVLEALERAAGVAQQTIERRWDDPAAALTHHVFGRIEMQRAVPFLTVHTAHHARQLRDALTRSR